MCDHMLEFLDNLSSLFPEPDTSNDDLHVLYGELCQSPVVLDSIHVTRDQEDDRTLDTIDPEDELMDCFRLLFE